MTRDRLYLEAIEEVYGNSNKVLIDSEGEGNLLYLPLDQLARQGNRSVSGSETNRASDSQTPTDSSLLEQNPADPRERVRREPR